MVTLGASGCFVSHPEETLRGDEATCYRVAAEPARVVDTTGAGDAFNGALAASLALRPGAAFAAHVRFASKYAALSTEREGAALAMPRLDAARTWRSPALTRPNLGYARARSGGAHD